MSKRILSLVLALVMVLGTFGTVFAADTAQKDAAEFLNEAEILLGNDKGDLMLDQKLERRDMVILLSRLMGEEEVASEFPTSEESPTWEDARTDAYYVPFFAWAQVNKFFAGNSEKEFAPREAITAQDYAVVLLRALGYDVEGHDAWKAALEDAKKLGILANVVVENATEITRGQMSVMTLNALAVNVKDSTKTLAETLEIVLPKAPEATKVESVHAENLKEIIVEFDGLVDEVTASDEANYSVNNSVVVEKAELSEDSNAVILTVKGTLTNQKEYELTVSKVKAADKVLATEKVKFTVLDNALPQVVEIKSLGTKALKVVVSEPVKLPATSNFKVDGKSYFGAISVDGRVITLKPYSSTSVLTPGEHKLTISGLTDFFGLKSLSQELEFEVVEDKTAPTVVEVTATLERAVVVFDEDIDPDTVNKNNFYWKSGTTKKYPNSVTVSGNKVTLDFDTNRLPAYQTSLFVINVADYSGNKMAETEVSINATVDQTRPEVTDVIVADDAKSVTVKFNKSVKGDDKAFYVFKDKDAKVLSVRSATNVTGKEVKVVLYSALAAGDNTLTISGVADTTTLKNVMLPQTFDLAVGDVKAPEVTSVSANSDTRTIIVNYSEAMDLASIANPANYLIMFKGSLRALPNGTEITPVQNGKAVLIILPEEIGDVKVAFVSNNVDHIQIMGVKDVAENILKDYVVLKNLVDANNDALVAKYDTAATTPENVYAALTDGKTIKVKFNQSIGDIKGTPIKLTGKGLKLENIKVDGTDIVTLELENSVGTEVYADFKIEILNDVNNYLVTSAGGKAAANNTIVKANIADRVKPEVVKDGVEVITHAAWSVDVDGKNPIKTIADAKINVTFTENVNVKDATPEQANVFAANDFEVTRDSDKKALVANVGYTVSINNNIVTITIINAADSTYTVNVKAGAYLQDEAGNKVEASEHTADHVAVITVR